MIERELEQRLQDWLRRDAAAVAVPAALQRRVLDIPASPGAGRGWWTGRFSLVAAPLATAAVLAVAVLGSQLFNAFDRPAGLDGGLCNDRQVSRALDALRDAAGYRYEARDELYDFDTTADFSFEDPQYAWRTGFAAEGAYRSPDRVREVVTVIDTMSRGYVEHLQVGDTTWRRVVGGRGDEWVRVPTELPTANTVHGYIQGAFPGFQIPGVTSLDWGGTAAPPDIPGSDGCTVATRIPGDGIGDVVALRIDVGTGLPIGVFRGPPADTTPRHGAVRYLFSLTWETPAEDEFAPPTNIVEPPAPPIQAPPPSEAVEQTPAPGAWQSQELPLPDGWDSGQANAVVHLGADGFVAVGAADRVASDGSYTSVAAVWTSLDGVTWDVVEEGPTTDMLSGIAWDGETLLATGLRTGGDATSHWEFWASADGRSWAPASRLGQGVQPGRLVPTSHGWVATSVHLSASAEASGGVQMTPAMLHSDDGSEWTESILPDTGSGGLSTVVERPDGTLLAFGCESPGGTNTAQFGEMCITRPWRSDDGLTWTSGPVLDLELNAVAVDGDGLVGIGSQGEPGRPAAAHVYRSADGETWTADPFSFGTMDELIESGSAGGPETIAVVNGTVVVEGARPGASPSGRPYPTLWRSTPDGGWEEVPVGFTAHGGFIEGIASMDGRLVLVGFLATSETASQPVVWLEPAE